VLTPAEARELLDSIDLGTVVGLRDRALIAFMAYTFARVSAATGMQVEDYFAQGKRWWCGCKGGKRQRCLPTTILRPIWMPISRRPG
jgi:integrase